jgi:hypothetical protein
MPGVIIGILVLWAIVAIIGLAVKTLFWLFIVGLIFFLITAVAAGIKRFSDSRRSV